jgi:hypothetical protein
VSKDDRELINENLSPRVNFEDRSRLGQLALFLLILPIIKDAQDRIIELAAYLLPDLDIISVQDAVDKGLCTGHIQQIPH